MKVEFVDVPEKKPVVEVVVGGVYKHRHGLRVLIQASTTNQARFYSMVNPDDGTQMNWWATADGVRTAIADGDYTHIPGAVLHIPKEVG